MKDKIIELLAGDSLAGYLSGIELFRENVGKPTLPDIDLDQAIIERACAIVVFERWCEHQDYIDALQDIIDTLPSYGDLIADEDVGSDLRGIAMFVNGLGQGIIDVSGFLFHSGSGYLMSYTAAESLQEHLEGKGDAEGAAFFQKTAAFFEQIYSTQMTVISILMGIGTWNSDMAADFYNILTASDAGTQSWMLGGLYKVIKDPVVKDEIFGKYLDVLKKVKAKYKKEKNESGVEQLDTMIKMVVEKSKGK